MKKRVKCLGAALKAIEPNEGMSMGGQKERKEPDLGLSEGDIKTEKLLFVLFCLPHF